MIKKLKMPSVNFEIVLDETTKLRYSTLRQVNQFFNKKLFSP